MANLKDYTASALMGIHHMGLRADDHSPALHTLFMHAADLAIAVRPPLMLTYTRSTIMCTTVRTEDGCVDMIRNDDGFGIYKLCDECGEPENVEYMECVGGTQMCESCIEKELDGDDDDLPLDTPSLDTMFHDHEMEC